jgi:uncharacterized protein (TIGR00369 family)
MTHSTFEHLKQSYESKPVLRHFGMEVLAASADQAIMRLPFSERVVNLAGTADGGALATLVDSVSSVAFEFGLDVSEVAITVDLRIDYIAPLTRGNAALAEARVVNRGRTIGRCETTIVEEASRKLLSKGTTVFVIRQRQRW